MKVTLVQRLEYAGFCTLMFVLNALPECLAYPLMSGIGQGFFLVSKRRRGYALRLLKNAYPERSDRSLLRLGRRATGNLFKVPLDMVRATRWIRSGRLLERVDTSIFERYQPGPHFVGVTAHLGSWEAGALAVAKLLGEAHGIAKTHKNPLMRRFLTNSRLRVGLHIHPRRGGLRGLRRALEAGKTAMQVVDQNQRLRGAITPFFGQPAATERAAATLAVRLGLPVAFGFCVRVGGGFRFRLDSTPAVTPPSSGDVSADVASLIATMNRTIEEFVLRYPEQYNWIHNRYRSGDPVALHPATEVGAPALAADSG